MDPYLLTAGLIVWGALLAYGIRLCLKLRKLKRDPDV
jgi:hypothetical protein